MIPIFNPSWQNHKMHIWCKFGGSSSNTLQVITHKKTNFLEFLVKMAKLTLKIIVNDPHFQYQLTVSQRACMVQIWCFQLKSVTSHHGRGRQGKVYGRTDTGNDNTPSAWKSKGLKKSFTCCPIQQTVSYDHLSEKASKSAVPSTLMPLLFHSWKTNNKQVTSNLLEEPPI